MEQGESDKSEMKHYQKKAFDTDVLVGGKENDGPPQ